MRHQRAVHRADRATEFGEIVDLVDAEPFGPAVDRGEGNPADGAAGQGAVRRQLPERLEQRGRFVVDFRLVEMRRRNLARALEIGDQSAG
jgi:hypothetical protein